ncbi:MAG: histidine kinase [Sphingobacteriales bacterium]|nr:histidine kinase [Sphingobacteriales bacterium]
MDHALLFYWFDFTLQVAVVDSVISNLLLLGICLLIMNTIRYYLPGREQFMNILMMCVALTLIWLFVVKWLLSISITGIDDYNSFLNKSLIIRFSIGILVVGIVTMMSINWFTWQEQKATEQRKTDAEKLAREAELFKLRQQLQPHFLFNSLNSINALIGSRPAEARKMVQQLSDFLRGTIRKEETQWVTLEEELQYLQLYLEIEKVRFGNRLSTEVNVDPATLNLRLPALLLQPIVENAIKFGLYDTVGETVIRLRTRVADQELLVEVSNPFDPETSSPQKGTGFGLKSVQRRLYLLFARADLLQTEATDHTFITRVKVPQPTATPDK